MKVALLEIANTDNISIINDGNYRLTLPDGSQVSPVYSGWVGENYKIVSIDKDEPIPTYLSTVWIGDNAGTGYTNGDILTVDGGVSVGNVAQMQVYGIGANDSVTSLIVSNSGFYTTDPEVNNNMVSGGSGSGLAVRIVMEKHQISSTEYAYDANGDVVVETNTYEVPVIDNTESIEQQRQKTIEEDPNNINLKDKLATATNDQIDNWINNNVTDLASAKVVLASIVKFLANKFKNDY